jgi:glutamate decarboxylase
MEEEAEKLMMENINKNFIDFEEYPQTAEISVSVHNIISVVLYLINQKLL